MKNRRFALALWIITGALISSTYNACSPGFSSGYVVNAQGSIAPITGSPSGGLCEQDIQSLYQRTYFPLLSQSCWSCHTDSQGSRDLATSWSAFQAHGQDAIDHQAETPHGGNSINLTPQIDAIAGAWAQGVSTYNACLVSSGVTGSYQLVTTDLKPTAYLSVDSGGNGIFQTLTYDLSQSSAVSLGTPLNLKFTIEVRAAKNNGMNVGLEFRNPMISLKAAGSPLAVRGLHIYIDDADFSSATIYQDVSAQVSTTAATALAPGYGYALVVPSAGASVNTKIGFAFNSIR